MEPTPLSVSLETNTAACGLLAVRLSPREAELLFVLISGRVVSEFEIANALWPNSDYPIHAVKDICYGLHKRLAPLGYGVCAYKSRGRQLYRLADGIPFGACARGKPNNTERNRRIIIYHNLGYSISKIAYAMRLSVDIVKTVIRRHKRKPNAKPIQPSI